MNADRILVVGVAWTLFLIALLVLREFVVAADRPSWRPILPFVNAIVVVMLAAAGLAAALQLASLAGPAPGGASTGRPSQAASGVAAGRPSPSVATISPSAAPSVSASPVQVSPVPTPRPTPITLSPPPTSTPSPTSVPPSPPPQPPVSPAPTASPAPTVATGAVSAGPEFRSYDVEGDRITGYRVVKVSQRFSASASAPSSYAFPSLSHPQGTVLLVRVESGPFAGIYVSPDDAGVDYQPPG